MSGVLTPVNISISPQYSTNSFKIAQEQEGITPWAVTNWKSHKAPRVDHILGSRWWNLVRMSNNRILGQKQSPSPTPTCKDFRCYGWTSHGQCYTGSAPKAKHDPVSARMSYCRVSERRWSWEIDPQGCRWCGFVGSQSKDSQAHSYKWWEWGGLLPDSPEPVCAAQHPGPGPSQQFSGFSKG